MPAGQEILDVRSSGVHDAKARDVDGAILDHLALPSVVHYLITAKYTGVLVHEGSAGRVCEMHRAILVRLRDKGCRSYSLISAFGILKGQSIVSRKASRLTTRSLIFRRVFKVDSRTGT